MSAGLPLTCSTAKSGLEPEFAKTTLRQAQRPCGQTKAPRKVKGTCLFLGFLFLFAAASKALATDPSYLTVHFLYGSKPQREFRNTERKWFGGKLGGHVGIEIDSNIIIDFVPNGDFHVVAHKNKLHSKFAVRGRESFWEIFGSPSEDVKKLSITIPLTEDQKHQLDSISSAYTRQTPYDYAFLGMRCGSAAYDILSQIGILEKYGYRKTCLKIFYPKKIRKRLLEKASQNHWTVARQEGTSRRKWEND